MCINSIANFFNNSTVASVVTLIGGAFIAKHIYHQQKNIDRKYNAVDKLGEALITLEEHCKSINQNIDRLAYTYKTTVEDGSTKTKERFIEALPGEINPMVTMMMYQIPEDLGKIGSLLSLHFSVDGKINMAAERIYSELKIWHDFVQSHLTGKSDKEFTPMDRVSDIPDLSLKELNSAIKELMNILGNN